jgi:hypothetical protein
LRFIEDVRINVVNAHEDQTKVKTVKEMVYESGTLGGAKPCP